MAPEPALDCRRHTLLIGLLALGQLQYFGNVQQTGDHRFAGLGLDPEHGAVLQGMPVRVLQGDLRLADPS